MAFDKTASVQENIKLLIMLLWKTQPQTIVVLVKHFMTTMMQGRSYREQMEI